MAINSGGTIDQAGRGILNRFLLNALAPPLGKNENTMQQQLSGGDLFFVRTFCSLFASTCLFDLLFFNYFRRDLIDLCSSR